MPGRFRREIYAATPHRMSSTIHASVPPGTITHPHLPACKTGCQKCSGSSGELVTPCETCVPDQDLLVQGDICCIEGYYNLAGSCETCGVGCKTCSDNSGVKTPCIECFDLAYTIFNDVCCPLTTYVAFSEVNQRNECNSTHTFAQPLPGPRSAHPVQCLGCNTYYRLRWWLL